MAMNISQGPMLERFSTVFGIPKSEVLDWVRTYVNHPEDMVCATEETEEERFQSIREYITWRLKNTSDASIKASIAQAKAEQGEAA